MNNLKRCQLQIVLANQGQFQALRRLGAFTPTEREYQSRQWFTTLASPSYTFDPTNYRETLRRDGTPLSVSWSPVKTGGGSNSRFRLLHIRSSLNRDQMEAFRKHEAYGPRNLNISSTNTPPIK